MATKVTGESYVKVDGQLFELKRQLRQPSGYPHDLALLVKGLQALIDGRFEGFMPPVIDLRAHPSVVIGHTVHKHDYADKFVWDPKKICLRLIPLQARDKIIDPRSETRSLNPFNANMLDFLLKKENWSLIPKDWFGKDILFCGTVYADEMGRQFVRYATFDKGKEPYEREIYLGGSWLSDRYVAVPVDQK